MDGQILETMYAWPEDAEDEKPMRVLNRTSVAVDEVSYINGKNHVPAGLSGAAEDISTGL